MDDSQVTTSRTKILDFIMKTFSMIFISKKKIEMFMESGRNLISVSGMSGFPPHFHELSSDDVGYTSKRACRQSLRIPCRARCLSHQHNRETAYIEIPRYAPHGMLLQCSHKECSQSGRRFRYCYGKILITSICMHKVNLNLSTFLRSDTKKLSL
jgi:hypothetical protein